MVKFLVDSLDNMEEATISSMDLSKAFDCIDHHRLSLRLESVGVRGPVLELIKSYLNNRFQVVDWKGNTSSRAQVEHGVPQGSILGPILFILYLDDLVSGVDADLAGLFVDDSTFMNRSKHRETLEKKARTSEQQAMDWFSRNKLSANEEKTQRLLITSRQTTQKNKVTILGLTFDTNLTWAEHVNSLCRRLSSSIFMIRRIRSIVGESAAILTYHAHFHSLATYGHILWGSSADAQKVFLKQKRALRVIAGINNRVSCREVFKKYQILTIPSSFIFECLLFVHGRKGQLPRHSDVHTYATRSRDNYVPPRHRLEKTKNTFLFLGTKVYNHLPAEVKSQPPNQFKKKLKKYLCDNAFYSIEEFLAHDYS